MSWPARWGRVVSESRKKKERRARTGSELGRGPRDEKRERERGRVGLARLLRFFFCSFSFLSFLIYLYLLFYSSKGPQTTF